MSNDDPPLRRKIKKGKWYKIPGFPHYRFKLPNKVKSLDRVYIQNCVGGTKATHVYKGRRLHPFVNHKGYLQLCLSDHRKCTTITIHKIVALIFLGQKPEGKEVNHRDGDKLNNHPRNLEYLTPLENMQHASRLGLRPKGKSHCMYGKLFGMHTNGKPHPALGKLKRKWKTGTPFQAKNHGSKNGQAKITELDVRNMRRIYAAGKTSQKMLAEVYELNQSTVSGILNGSGWSHVK